MEPGRRDQRGGQHLQVRRRLRPDAGPPRLQHRPGRLPAGRSRRDGVRDVHELQHVRPVDQRRASRSTAVRQVDRWRGDLERARPRRPGGSEPAVRTGERVPCGRRCLPPNGYRLASGVGSMGLDEKTGLLAVYWDDFRNGDYPANTNNDVFMAYSTDGGANWGQTIIVSRSDPSNRLSSQPAAQWQAWGDVGANRKLYVAYYDRQNGDCDASGCNDITLATSTNLGRTWSYQRITTASMPNLTAANNPVQAGFLGDYMSIQVVAGQGPHRVGRHPRPCRHRRGGRVLRDGSRLSPAGTTMRGRPRAGGPSSLAAPQAGSSRDLGRCDYLTGGAEGGRLGRGGLAGGLAGLASDRAGLGPSPRGLPWTSWASRSSRRDSSSSFVARRASRSASARPPAPPSPGARPGDRSWRPAGAGRMSPHRPPSRPLRLPGSAPGGERDDVGELLQSAQSGGRCLLPLQPSRDQPPADLLVQGGRVERAGHGVPLCVGSPAGLGKDPAGPVDERPRRRATPGGRLAQRLRPPAGHRLGLGVPKVAAGVEQGLHVVGVPSSELVERPGGHGGPAERLHRLRRLGVAGRLQIGGEAVAGGHEVLGRARVQRVDPGVDLVVRTCAAGQVAITLPRPAARPAGARRRRTRAGHRQRRSPRSAPPGRWPG